MSNGSSETALPIGISGLTKKYDRLYALNSVDLEIHSGEFLTLLGPSGSGKTTLLMALAGFSRPDAGSIRFGDKEVVLTPPHRREVGMVFQNYALFPHMSVAENIAFPLRLRRVPASERDERVAQALDTVQLSGLGHRRIDQLSGGQRQRVALARAFVFRPRILLMDEPLSALDKKLRERMQIELKQLHSQLGVTTVYVTHDQREALTMSDRIAVINHGKLIQVDTPSTIYNQPANSFVADFIGESTMLPLERDGSGQFFFNEQLINVELAADTEKDWVLVVRPERLFVFDAGAGSSDEVLLFDGVVADVVFQGESSLAIVQVDQYELAVRFESITESSRSDISSGAPITLGLARKDAIYVPREQSQ